MTITVLALLAAPAFPAVSTDTAKQAAPAPKPRAPVKIIPKRAAPPEPDPRLERLEAFCGNEIGLLCKSKKGKVKALTACLTNYWDNLLPACRTALRAGN